LWTAIEDACTAHGQAAVTVEQPLIAENSDVEWGKQSLGLAQFKASLDTRDLRV
jgi:hypothetical protein